LDFEEELDFEESFFVLFESADFVLLSPDEELLDSLDCDLAFSRALFLVP
jgi:hypothetical protein